MGAVTLNRRIKCWLTAVLALAIAGCVPASTVKQEALTSVGTFAVVSLLGNTLRCQLVGTTVFNNEYYEVAEPRLDIDRKVSAKLAETLKSDGGYTVIDIGPDLTALEKVYPDPGASFFRTDFDLKRIESDLKRIAAEKKVDAFVLVLRSSGQDCMGECTVVPLMGYGLYRRSKFGKVTSTTAYSRVYLAAVRASDFVTIGEKHIRSFDQLGESFWNMGYEKLAEPEKAAVLDSLERQLTRETSVALREVGVTK